MELSLDLSPAEVRVLGCLMEKQITTPDQYPLTANSLRLACNQTTNRHPVVRFDDDDIAPALVSLRERGLTRIVYSESNRAAKHRHVADDVLGLDAASHALLAVLLLRGAQTVGELKQRAERMHAFASLQAVDDALDELATRPQPLAIRLQRRPGQKEERYMHLVGGAVDEATLVSETTEPATTTTGPSRTEALEQRVEKLEAELERLRTELHDQLGITY